MFSLPKFLRVDQDQDKDCALECGGPSQKALCASDGRTFLSRCEFQRAKCRDPQLQVAHRGSCRGKRAGGRQLGRPRTLSSHFANFYKQTLKGFQLVGRFCSVEEE